MIFLFAISFCKYSYYNIFYPLNYVETIRIYAKENQISPALISSIINTESSFNQFAKSNSNAIGLMQILPSTAEYICELNNIDYDEQKLFEADYNIKLGCLYMRYLQNKFHDFKTTLCAYNAGETIVRSWLNNPNYSQDSRTLYCVPYNETSQYVDKVMSGINIYKQRF